MKLLYRLLLVIIILLVLVTMALDYLAFHGSYVLSKVGGGTPVTALDDLGGLFQGPHASTNILFFAIIGVGLIAVLVGMTFKFIKG